METRIKLSDSIEDVMAKISGGNPGALTVCMNILKHAEEIDPDALVGGLAALLSLDTHGIYDCRIWMLYKDVCGEDLPTMLAVNRACQLGIISKDILNAAIDDYGNGIDIPDVVRQVKARLPAFQYRN